jgi:hypothetical protein
LGGNNIVSTQKLNVVNDWPVPSMQGEDNIFVQFYNFDDAKFIHHFSGMSAPLTDFQRNSQPYKPTLTPIWLEAIETLKLRLISAPCMLLPEVGSDATSTVATDVSTLRIATVLLHEQGG